MPQFVLATVTLNKTSGVPEDAEQNQFALLSNNPLVPDVPTTLVTPALDQFFEELAPYMSGTISRAANAHTVEYYDVTDHLDGSAHGSPFAAEMWTLSTAGQGGRSAPDECAICITLYGEGRQAAAVGPAGGPRPKQRRTGRLYIGSLGDNSYDSVDNGVRVTDACRGTFAAALANLVDTLNEPAAHTSLCVWSRADAAMRECVGGHVDNALDTQRRRGVAPTRRTTFATILA